MKLQVKYAYIFLDESGDLVFGPKGTRYFVLTSVSMYRPFPVCEALDSYKHYSLERDVDIEYFHCSNDSKNIRKGVFEKIIRNLEGMHIDCLVIDKSKITAPALREEKRFYRETLICLLKDVLPRERSAGAEKIIVITDTVPVKRQKKTVERGIKNSLAKELPPVMECQILHHSSRSHYGLQVADYCCWALFRKWENEDSTYYDRISGAVRGELGAEKRKGKE